MSGMRAGTQVAILIDIEGALASGLRVDRSPNGVVLTAGLDGLLPKQFFTKAVWPSMMN